MTKPQSCTATIFFTLTMPVSASTSTSAICAPPTPLLVRSGALLLSGFLPRTVSGIAPQLGTGFFPAKRWAGIALHAHCAVHAFQLVRLGVKRGRNFGKQRVTGIYGGTACRGTDSANGCRAPRTA